MRAAFDDCLLRSCLGDQSRKATYRYSAASSRITNVIDEVYTDSANSRLERPLWSYRFHVWPEKCHRMIACLASLSR